ncbi:Uncharacterised protein [Mitsuokella jalaludinii]|uniref:Uncharacterized protein n=1 Tax=Mitsuokella jalaludinii TaxID=187979 RepID=A0A173XLT1_9FIRM|nr:Uncharacterised protein [Mitsuokella jalaludinii]
MNNFREKGIGFLSDSLAEGVERACDARNRGGIRQLLSQGSEGPIHFEIYYKENQNDSPITSMNYPWPKTAWAAPMSKKSAFVSVGRESAMAARSHSCT